jgi:deoxyribonuclease V
MARPPGVWPTSQADLEHVQRGLAERAAQPPAWTARQPRPPNVGAVFVATPRTTDQAWAAAVVVVERRLVDSAVVQGELDAPYLPGLLALREGRLLEHAVRQLRQRPDVLLVNASGRDHPRRAGLAVHLGAVCDVPTIGVTDRPLLAVAAEPGQSRGAASPLVLDGEVVGYLLRTRPGARPIVVHAAWRTDPDTARVIVLGQATRARTPEPLRHARRLARTARVAAELAL